MKKNFKGGLSSLLGEQPEKPKRGRPVTQTKEIYKSSQEGTKENETRATFIVDEELLDKIKAVAYWDRKQIKEVINTALSSYIKSYEKKAGEIDITPIREKRGEFTITLDFSKFSQRETK
jgi:hypothetical protein